MIEQVEAHCDLSSSCVATLVSGLSLLDRDLIKEDRLRRIASGIYGLVPYAIKYWTEHLCSYASNGGSLVPDHPLPMLLDSLLSKHDQMFQLTQADSIVPISTPQNPSQDEPDKRLELLSQLPVYSLLGQSIQFRRSPTKDLHENGQGKSVVDIDREQNHAMEWQKLTSSPHRG